MYDESQIIKFLILKFQQKLLPVLMAYFPSGTSNKCGRHLNQLTKGDFLYYNYGRKGNLARYNSVTPPAYNLSNVRVPVSLYYGTKDQFVGHKVSLRLRSFYITLNFIN